MEPNATTEESNTVEELQEIIEMMRQQQQVSEELDFVNSPVGYATLATAALAGVLAALKLVLGQWFSSHNDSSKRQDLLIQDMIRNNQQAEDRVEGLTTKLLQIHEETSRALAVSAAAQERMSTVLVELERGQRELTQRVCSFQCATTYSDSLRG